MGLAIKYFFSILILLLLAACVANNGIKALQAPQKVTPIYESGSIFKPGINERPLYEVKRPRNVGDGLTMIVAEMSVADNKSPGKDKGGNADKGNKDKRNSEDESSSQNRHEDEDKPGFANIDSQIKSNTNMVIIAAI